MYIDGLAVSNGTGGYKEALQINYSRPLKITILGETIGHDKNPSKNQADEIFGMGGDDVVVAGASVDRIKGGSGNDTIWGGTNSGADFGQYGRHSLVFWTRYNVVQNVFVKAPKENVKLLMQMVWLKFIV